MAKTYANAKQHPKAELLLLEIFHFLHPRYHSKIIGHTLKNKQMNKYVCIPWGYTSNHDENEDKIEK